MKNHRNFVRFIKSLSTYTVCCSSVFICEMVMVSKFYNFCLWQTFLGIFFQKCNMPLHAGVILALIGLVSIGVSLTSWGECASLALVGHPSSDGITIKITYGVDVLLYRPALHPIFSY